MDATAQRRLGRTGVMLTQLGLGTAPLGELFTRVTEEQAAAVQQAAWDAGIRYFDTAPWYGRGQSEHRVGRFLYARPREDFVLSTKVGRLLRAPRRSGPFDTGFWTGGLHFDAVFDYSYDGILRAFEDSLQRLGLNRVDLLIIHDLDFRHHMVEPKVAAYLAQLTTGGWRALEELRNAGVIRGLGCGINELGMIPRFLDLFDLDFFLIALQYTLAQQAALDAELPSCERRGAGVVIGGVFNSGILATGPIPGAKYDYEDATPAQRERVGRIEAVCRRHGVPPAAAALQFPLGHPCVASVIPGAVTPEQVAMNLRHFTHPIPADLWAELKAEHLLCADAPVPSS
jgi:D-threo-aldose 1-dehydrogenase